ncbi:hypothetical protein SMICM304S_01446 [Streptomyces microflavus]
MAYGFVLGGRQRLLPGDPGLPGGDQGVPYLVQVAVGRVGVPVDHRRRVPPVRHQPLGQPVAQPRGLPGRVDGVRDHREEPADQREHDAFGDGLGPVVARHAEQEDDVGGDTDLADRVPRPHQQVHQPGADHREERREPGVGVGGLHDGGGEPDADQGAAEAGHGAAVRLRELRAHHHDGGHRRPVAVPERQGGADEVARDGDHGDPDRVAEDRGAVVQLPAHRLQDDRDQPQQGGAVAGVGGEVFGDPALGAGTLRDLQDVVEEGGEPVGGAEGGADEDHVVVGGLQDAQVGGGEVDRFAVAYGPCGGVEHGPGGAEELVHPGPLQAVGGHPHRRVGQRGEDRTQPLRDAPGAVELGGAAAGLARGDGGGAAGGHQGQRVEGGDRVVAQPPGVVGLGGQRVGERVALGAPSPDREQDDQRRLDHAADQDHPGMGGGVHDGGRQGDRHEHDRDVGRGDDPARRARRPGKTREEGPAAEQTRGRARGSRR